jgi:hypothetical protein
MHAKETKSRTYMQWSAEPAEASMERKDQQQATRSWTTRRDEKKRRMGLVSSWMSGPLLPREKLVDSLEAFIAPTDRIVLEPLTKPDSVYDETVLHFQQAGYLLAISLSSTR